MSDSIVVVVTGAGGYIGGHVARALGDKHGREAVRCLVRREDQAVDLRAAGFPVIVGDILDGGIQQRLVQGARAVVHAAAALGHTPWTQAVAVNVAATRDLADRAREAGVRRFVHVSSIEAYGAFDGRVLDEPEPFRPNGDTYATTKALAELGVRHVFADLGTQGFVILRLGAVYGPASPFWTRRYLDKALNGRIRVIGKTGQIFPVYEDDAVAAIVSAVENPAADGEAFNVVHDERLTWWNWANEHHRAVGTGHPMIANPTVERLRSLHDEWRGRPGQRRKLEVQLRRATIPHARAAAVLGWAPRSFQEGMRRCVQQGWAVR